MLSHTTSAVQELEPYHSWLMRKTSATVFRQAPKYATALRLLAAGHRQVTSQAEQEHAVRVGMAAFVDAGKPLVAELQRLFVALRLEDTRQV